LLKKKVLIKIVFCIYIVAIIESLINYRTIAPYAEETHPYHDHSLPLLAAFGAAGGGCTGNSPSPELEPGGFWGEYSSSADNPPAYNFYECFFTFRIAYDARHRCKEYNFIALPS
jgi:hypothetical protein